MQLCQSNSNNVMRLKINTEQLKLIDVNITEVLNIFEHLSKYKDLDNEIKIMCYCKFRCVWDRV